MDRTRVAGRVGYSASGGIGVDGATGGGGGASERTAETGEGEGSHFVG